MSKDEKRLLLRSDLEDKIREYYNLCLSCDYDFNGDICDIVFDATEKTVVLDY